MPDSLSTNGSGSMSQQNTQLAAQILSILGMLATSFGWLTPEQVQGITANILALIGPVMTLAGLAVSVYSARKKAIVNAVAALPEVRAVVTEPTPAGRDLANSTDTASNVVVAHPPGTPIPTPPPHP